MIILEHCLYIAVDDNIDYAFSYSLTNIPAEPR
jgi:hypothetical protein